MNPILNAFVDDDGKDIIVIEQVDGGIHQRRIQAQYTSYHQTSAINASLYRSLKRADQVAHVVHETERWIRIGWKSEIYRRQARYKLKDEGVESYEGDVHPVRYWLTQTKGVIAKPRRCYLDIEADSRVAFSKKEEMRILCWAISDDTGPVARGILSEDTIEAERTLLEKLWAVLADYDQVIAWYGGDPDDKDAGFDFFVIAARTRKCGLTIDTRRWLWLDQLVVWRRMNSAESGEEKESMRLEDISQNQLGEGKDVTPDWVIERFGNKSLGALAWDLWFAGGKFRKLLVDYCVKDTELLRKLEDRKGFLTLFQSICEATAVFGDTRGLYPTGQMDGFLLRLGREHDYRFATKTYSDDVKTKGFEGAFVLAPKTVASKPDERGTGEWTAEQAAAWRRARGMTDGILRDVHVCDFASLYPSNIITWNLSEEVLVKDDKLVEAAYHAYKNGEPLPPDVCFSPGTGVLTYTDKIGILPLALRELLRLRKKYADEAAQHPPGTPKFVDAMAKSTAYKVVANSFYGVAGARTSRYYNKDIARSTTQNGVWLIKNVMKEGEKRQIESIAGDTDSSFVIGPTRAGFDTFVNWLNGKHLPKIIAATGAKESTVKLAFEKTFDILIFTTKKRYCNPPETPIMMANGSFKKLDEVKIGDVVLGWIDGAKMIGSKKRTSVHENTRRRLRESTVAAVHRHVADIVKVTMESGRTFRCTADHKWRSHGRSGTYSDYVTPKVGRLLSYVASEPPILTHEQQRAADWLGGIWDGEGSLASGNRGQIIISQSRARNPEVCKRIEESLSILGFRYAVSTQRNVTSACETYAIRGSLQERLNFLAWCRPAKWEKLSRALMKSRFAIGDRIVKIEPDGRGEVIGMTTSTGNYIAWGYASKNCGRYNHYKWKTTCNLCKDKKGNPGSVDVRTLECKDCKHVYTEQPVFLGKPEIKGLEYRRGDATRFAREMQGEMIDLMVGGMKLVKGLEDYPRPIMNLYAYEAIIERWRNRVLNEPLSIENVRRSQSIKDLSEYASSAKKGDDPDKKVSIPPHVAVAKILQERGQSITAGTKIDYVVVDGDCSPMRVIPAEDYAGECDRYYLWDSMVYPPTQRLLEGAFPEVDWSSWGDVRPEKIRKGKSAAPKGQYGFSFTPKPVSNRVDDYSDLAIPAFTKKPLAVRIPEAIGEAGIERVNAVLRANPGARSVEIVIVLKSGAEALLRSEIRVATGPKLAAEVAKVIEESATTAS